MKILYLFTFFVVVINLKYSFEEQSTTISTTTTKTTTTTTINQNNITTTVKPITKFNIKQCFQKRFLKKNSNYEKELQKYCNQMMIDNFCDHVECLKIDKCPDDYELIENIVGNNCCPACVKLLDENDFCIPESLSTSFQYVDSNIQHCKNGLICDHRTFSCQIPDIDDIKTKHPCLFDYHNRWSVRQDKYFYIMSGNPMIKLFFQIQYAHEQYLPKCTFDGNYLPKQSTQNKAYCVNPNDGRPSFGVIDSHRSINQTCKCSQSMQDKLILAKDRFNPNNPMTHLDNVITEFNSDTHMKCKFSGNYHEVQCINETCLCVNEKTGRPILDSKFVLNNDWAIEKENVLYEPKQPQYVRWQSAVAYGASNRLICFDEETEKKKGKSIEKSYKEECFIEKHRTSEMIFHFAKKGTTLNGLGNTKCGFDDNYYRVQCPDAACTCHDPDGGPITPYRADSKLSQDIDCRCALEEYLSKTGILPVGISSCDGLGNFLPIQCTQNRQICYCVDDNGARISEHFIMENFHNYKLKTNGGTDYFPEVICQMMRETLSLKSDYIIKKDQHFCYNPRLKNVFSVCDKPSDDEIFK